MFARATILSELRTVTQGGKRTILNPLISELEIYHARITNKSKNKIKKVNLLEWYCKGKQGMLFFFNFIACVSFKNHDN